MDEAQHNNDKEVTSPDVTECDINTPKHGSEHANHLYSRKHTSKNYIPPPSSGINTTHKTGSNSIHSVIGTTSNQGTERNGVSSSQTQYCNNCNKQGHSYNTCKSPITSVGIIAFRPGHNGIEYLMIRRRDSFGFVDFIRGRYPIHNEEYIRRIVDEMTIDEKNKLQTQTFQQMWNGLWGAYSGNQYKSEESFSLEKYNSLKNGVRFRENKEKDKDKEKEKEKDKDKGDPSLPPPPKYTLDTIISESTTRWTETEWGFPKGRRNYHEKDVVCALRECLEETGYEILVENVIQNIAPYEEVFMGSDMKCYKHKYYLAYMDIQHSQLKTHDTMEVSDMRWMTYDECMKTIRPYNLEKKTILTRVNRVLQEYRLT